MAGRAGDPERLAGPSLHALPRGADQAGDGDPGRGLGGSRADRLPAGAAAGPALRRRLSGRARAAPAPARLPGAPGVPRGHPGPRAEGRGPGPPGAAAGAGAGGNRRAGSAAPRPRGSAAARAAARVGRRGTRPGAGRARRLGPEAGRGGALPGARHPLTGGRAAWRGPVKQVAAGMFLRPAVRSFAAMAQDFRLQVSPRTIWIAGLHILGVAIVWRSVYRVGAVGGLVGVALLFRPAVEPALRKLKSFGVPRGLGVALVVAASAAILALLLGTLIPMLVVQLQSLLTAL